MSEFDLAAADLVANLGSGGTYTQAGVRYSLDVFIERSVDTIDEFGNVVVLDRAAFIASSKLPVEPLSGDTIEVDGTTYRVERRVEDDGHMITLALSL